MSTINVRIDAKTKNKTQKILREMGLDLSSAIKIFLNKIIITKSIPFEIRTVNGFTPEFEQELLEASRDALTYSKGYDTPEELHAEILKGIKPKSK
jgi:DNA-damage-inducible protein J